MAMSCFRAPVLLLVYYGLLGSTDVCQGVKVCENDLLPLPLGLEECSTENCRGTCSRGTNPDGYVFDICCADPKTYTCYNRSNLMGIREACFNASSENDTACESFDVNVQCVAELYNKTFEECRWQYLHLYQMVFITSNGFDPKNCNEDMHKISDKFEFRPHRTTDYRVSCPSASKTFPIDL